MLKVSKYEQSIIQNKLLQLQRNPLYPCHFKLIVNAGNNSIYYSAESNSFIQFLEINNKTLTNLNVQSDSKKIFNYKHTYILSTIFLIENSN